MVNKLIQDQLKKVEKADLSHFDPETNTYTIPKRNDIKLEQNKNFFIHLKSTFYTNDVVKNNWNSGSVPQVDYLIVVVNSVMNNMANVTGRGYDVINRIVTNYMWSGWISLGDVEILQKL